MRLHSWIIIIENALVIVYGILSHVQIRRVATCRAKVKQYIEIVLLFRQTHYHNKVIVASHDILHDVLYVNCTRLFIQIIYLD